MNRQQLIEQIKIKKSFLSIGLDTDIHKIPKHLLDFDDPVFEFNKQIIDATKNICVSYKINTAFYECRGIAGWQSLIKTFNYLPKDIFSIADAKRGDIGNTSAMYADAFFNKESSNLDFDAVTVAPYMGADSVKPFLSYKGKWTILLALTSNESAQDFQFLETAGKQLFETVLTKSQEWANEENMMYVVGATKGKAFADIRKLAPNHFLLVPGVGAQGGSLADVCKYGITKECGLIVNSSRAIIYASNGYDFAEAAKIEAEKVQLEMENELKIIGL
ncbi:orotidine 5'-phosphate decarboxylase [Pedobacter psychrophilus]|uniref:Orotidine-5'-phosphate decarboxylase n=1 Tax=Pedobacter psychrophilus TaxID=1826909 RepID=A0A179DMY7_9SPHI|nr:orotidine-5'-phosphate decarboxylase [Pedobacter psychrophilus]OAQ42162.1 orotidine 5'-phosphate decarboxylase [Pedobacter psychrophilus]